MPGPVDWEFAAKVAARVTGAEPFARSYHWDSLAPDFSELTAEAEELVAESTGLRSSAGPARARVIDRAGWVDANIASFNRILRPLTEKVGERMGAGPMAAVTRSAAGFEMGVVLGWMSKRVLGQYDLLVVEDEDPDSQDVVYYVGPNVLALEKRFAFPPREFRLWLALHEVTHRAQFTGIEWLRPHFLGLIRQVMDSFEPDPQRFIDAIRRITDALRRGVNPLDDGGLALLFASAQQRDVLEQVGGLMSLLEGHGDTTMDRAGAALIPSAERFGRVLRERRNSSKGATRLLQRLLGLEAKLNQYEQGEHFVRTVEGAGGGALLERAWEAAGNLPTLEEIRDPDRWIRRMAESGTDRRLVAI